MISQKIRRLFVSFSIVWFVYQPRMGWGQAFSKQRYETLIQKIQHHDDLYYGEGQPVISDGEYDALLDELEAIEQAHPEWIRSSSPSQHVGSSARQRNHVLHKSPMLSIKKTRDMDELVAFDQQVQELLGHDVEYCLEDKVDGVAISLHYEQGQFVRALTRGNGQQGNDVTKIIETISSVPKQLVDHHDFLDVRGEIYISKDEFAKINKERKERNQSLFANARNLAAGSLNLKDEKEAARRNLQLQVFSVGSSTQPLAQSQKELLARLSELGFQTQHNSIVCGSMEEVMVQIDSQKNSRDSLPYEVDGLVIKVNDLKNQQALGATGKYVQGMLSYKFYEAQTRAMVKDIIWQVGRTGKLTPVAILEPVYLDGSWIQRASLHNANEIERLDVRVGDTIILQKAGRIIPKVVRVVKQDESTRSIAFNGLEQCPICLFPVAEQQKGSYVCHNFDCLGRIKEQLEYFAHRDRMNITGLGEATISLMVDAGLVRHPSDLYQLDANSFAKLDDISKDKANVILASIEASKNQSSDNVLTALGIRFVGKQKAKILINHFESIDALANATIPELQQIPGIGKATANSIFQFFQDKKNRNFVELWKTRQRLLS